MNLSLSPLPTLSSSPLKHVVYACEDSKRSTTMTICLGKYMGNAGHKVKFTAGCTKRTSHQRIAPGMPEWSGYCCNDTGRLLRCASNSLNMPCMCAKPTCADGQDCGCIDTDEASSDLLFGGFADAPKKAQFGMSKGPPVCFGAPCFGAPGPRPGNQADAPCFRRPLSQTRTLKTAF
jgi:hypothetical protein